MSDKLLMVTNLHPTFSASLMCAQLDRLGAEARRLERAGVDSLHVDLMDGHFVPNLAFGPDTVAALRLATRLPIVAHAMVEEPEALVEPLSRAGAQCGRAQTVDQSSGRN